MSLPVFSLITQIMDVRALKDLVRQGEGDRLEFKLKSNHPERIIREAVAFANTRGGKLLIGVSDDKSIKGVKDAEEDKFALERAIERYCIPSLPYQLEQVMVSNEREVLVFTIPRSPDKPHFVRDSEGKRKAYVRVGDKSVQASWEMREIMRRSKTTRDVHFRYGEKEKKLMQLLDQREYVTVAMFADYAGISRKSASQTLIILVLANVLDIHPDEVMDKYSLATAY